MRGSRLMKHLFLAMLMLTTGGTAMADDMKNTQKATFAAGCFWCLEKPFDKLEGVHSTISGYTGGQEKNPTYQEVAGGQTGHTEAMRVTYDPEKISYEDLLHVYWRNVDPFDLEGQFCDRGSQYRPAIFVHNEAQRKAAEASKAETSRLLGKEVLVPIVEAGTFYEAEDYHQNYYQENPLRYKFYRFSCGRDKRLGDIWQGIEDQ